MRYPAGRRDPSPDPSKPLIAVGVLGVAGFLLWRFVLSPKAQAAPSAPGGTQPGPGPGNVPGSPTPTFPGKPPQQVVADSVQQGDTITVSPSALANVLGSANVPPADVEMVVTGASPGLPVVLARTTGNPLGVPAGVDAPVPRDAITSTTHPAPGGQVTPPQPGGPGVLPGLPGVIPPTFAPVDLGSPIPLVQGHHYRARLELGVLEATFANPDAVKAALQSQTSSGFGGDLVVFGPDDALPADWPLVTVLAKSKNTYYAMGTWNGPSGPAARPPQVSMIWEQ